MNKAPITAAKAEPGQPQLFNAPLSEGPIARALYGMAMPMAGGILATMSFNIVDTFFVAGLGDEALAALSFTFPVAMMAISLSIGLGAGTSSVVAKAAGRSDQHAVRVLTTDALTLTLLLSLVFSVVGYLSIDPFFRALGASEAILPLIRDYMVWWYLGITLLLGPMVGLASMRALGNTKLQAKLMIGIALANVALDPLLIYGWWIFPRLEIQGAAIASLIVRVVSMVVTMYVLQVKMRLLVNPFAPSRIWRSWQQILHVGIPAMATNMIIPVSGSVLIALVAANGADAVAGFGVATRVESMALILFYALSSVIGPFCGQNLGAGKIQRLHDSQRISAQFCVAAGLVISILLALFGKWIAAIFSDDAAVIATTYQYLLIVPISYCAYGVVMVVNASFNGLGKPLPGVAISAARVIIILLPLAWMGNQLLGVWGIFVAIALSNVIVGVGAYAWVHRAIRSQGIPAARPEPN